MNGKASRADEKEIRILAYDVVNRGELPNYIIHALHLGDR
jgi:hypothetical protein